MILINKCVRRFRHQRILSILKKNLCHDAGLKTLTTIIPKAFQYLRLVGGAVRDGLLGYHPTDFDIATIYTPEKIITFLNKANIPYKTMGLAHGTVSVFMGGKTYDITTCRSDITTNGRWAQVAYTRDWKVDAMRRDFSCNALYMTMDGTLIDYFKGVHDLQTGTIRFIGQASRRLCEDRLRLLRYFRFWVHVGKQPLDKSLIPLFQDCASHLSILSGERVGYELFKILKASVFQWQVLLPHMTQCHVWRGLFDCYSVDIPLALKARTPLARVWAIIRDNHSAMKRLNLSRQQQNYLKILSHIYSLPQEKAFYIYDTFGLCALRDWADLCCVPDHHLPSSLPLFPLSATSLMTHGLKGPHLGMILKKTRHWWQTHQGVPSHEACLSYALKHKTKTFL